MKSFQSRLGIAVAGLALVAAPAFASQRPSQDGTSPAADRAVDRGSSASAARGGDGGSVASGGSSAGSSSSSTAPSAIASSPSFGSADRSAPMYAEPQRRGGGSGSASGGSSHRGGGGSGGDRAVPRGSGGSSSRGTSKSGGDSTTSSGSAGRSHDAPARDNGEAVPSWSRPRGDRPASGTAAEREGRRPDRDGRNFRGRGFYPYYYDPFYFGYSPYYGYRNPGFGIGYGYGLGLGWPLFYDPWYDPWYGSGGYAGYGYGSTGYNTSGYAGLDQGKIRLKVKPRQAKVYVDGYFVGNVDQFDGVFQKLSLNGGRHRVEIKADGYETAEFDVLITPDETVTYQGELKKIQ
jgi:hypothetical protein